MPSKTTHTHTQWTVFCSSKENYMLLNIFYKTYLIMFSVQGDVSYIWQWLPKTDTIKKPIMRSNSPRVSNFWIPVIFLEVRWSSYYPWAGWSTCLWSCDEMLNESKWGPVRHDSRNSKAPSNSVDSDLKGQGWASCHPNPQQQQDSDGQSFTSVTSLHVHQQQQRRNTFTKWKRHKNVKEFE